MSSETRALPLSPSRPHVRSALFTLLLFSLGHFCVDLYSGSIGVFQPYLIRQLGMNLTQAGILGGLLIFSSSVTQPLYGYLADRYRSHLFSALGPAVAGLFVAGLGLAPNYHVALVMVLLGGAGISAFHPQGSSWAAAGLTTHRARGMAVFISAGTLGYAVAPVFFSGIIHWFGFPRVVWAALPALAVTLFLLLNGREPDGLPQRANVGFDWPALRAVRRPLSILYAGVFFRSAVQITFAQFLVLYLNRERGYSLENAAYVLTLYLTFGALGGFVGGHLSDLFGARRVIILSFGLSVPFLAAFFFTASMWGVVSLLIGGFILLFTIPINVLLAQQLVPSQAATVSALLMGFAWGAAGMLFIPLTGWVSDHFSIHTALSSLLIFPIAGFWLTRKLPEDLGR
jgi:MFS transporter, FSR family, fosmidomycin resistance protein